MLIKNISKISNNYRKRVRTEIIESTRFEADVRLGFRDLGLVPGEKYSVSELTKCGIDMESYKMVYDNLFARRLDSDYRAQAAFSEKYKKRVRRYN